MYIPKVHEEARLNVLHDLIETHPLGTWVSAAETELEVNHVPFVLDRSHGEFGTLYGHIARANPIWKQPPSAQLNAIVFRGPQTYITPSWYPSKHQHGKAVPTWNYAVVSVHGQPEFFEDSAWLYEHLTSLTDAHEAQQALPWKVGDAPPEFTDKLVSAIIGVAVTVQRIEGKWKTNQNRPEPDKIGVVAGLTGKGDDDSMAMASLVRQHTRS